jgi:hypothetical protein
LFFVSHTQSLFCISASVGLYLHNVIVIVNLWTEVNKLTLHHSRFWASRYSRRVLLIKISRRSSIQFSELTRNICAICKCTVSGRNQTCGSENPVQESKQLSYKVQYSSSNHKFWYTYIGCACVRHG